MNVQKPINPNPTTKAPFPKPKILLANQQRIYAIIALVLITVFFSFAGNKFFSYDTFLNILSASYYIGFLAIGVTFVIITGGIDLSVGTVAICSAMFGGVLWSTYNWPFELALIAILVMGIVFGLFNGILVSLLKLPPFIATLGTMMISMGLSNIISKSQTIHFPGSRDPKLGWFKEIFSYTKISLNGQTTKIPSAAFFLFGGMIVAHLILNKTRLGRYIFAMGSNEEAVRLSGVNTRFWKVIPYVISSTCAAIGGIFYASTFTSIPPGGGQGLELNAIAGVVIGGTSLAGGVGSIFGTLIGVFIMSVLSTGLLSTNAQQPWQLVLTGCVVILAVLLDISQQKKR